MLAGGARIIDCLAADLRRDFPETTGLSSRKLKSLRALVKDFPRPYFRAEECRRVKR